MTFPAPPAAAPRATILLVDDEAEILIALQDLLEDAFTILTSTSPPAALDLLAAHPEVAVIVSDQRMPEMPGNVFLARARNLSAAEAILLTGYAELTAVTSALNDGAISGYAQKPWEPEALRAMIIAAAERHRLRAALLFEQRVFRALTDGGSDAVAVLDGSGTMVRANARMRERQDARSAEFAEADDDADRAALASAEPSETVSTDWDTARGQRWFLTRRTPFEDAEGRRHLLKIEIDETVRRVAEQKLHQAEKLQALGTLAGGIAHDFNNLLAVVIGNLELATRNGSDPARLTRYLASASEAASRGSAISRRLLSFTRQRDVAAESFDPGTAIREVEDLVTQAMAGRATIRLELDPAVWAIRTDPGQFELAIVNLCINARDAMLPGQTVVIAAQNCTDGLPTELPPGDYVRVTVADSGTGMSAEIKARVFEPFYTTKPHGQGTGLGLPMVRSMAEAAGGTVTIDSELGIGTSIHLWLPRDRAPAAISEAAPTTSPQRPLRILLAEDDPAVRETLAEQLRHAGHHLTIVASGEQALDLLADSSIFDLLVTDHAMPGLSGGELANRALAAKADLPILLITGFAEIELIEGLVVLRKPFTTDQLLGRVQEAVKLRRRRPNELRAETKAS
jgi:signal transduction histidine kinase/two-component SAPR family response regulator